MAAGELTHESGSSALDPDSLETGAVVTASGRVSAAKMYEPVAPTVPFSSVQLSRLDEALTLASRETGLDFSVYIGELGEDSRAGAESLHASIGPRAAQSVLIAVSPGERVVEVVTGEAAYQRLPDRVAKFAVMGMVASFKEGDLIGGLISALRMMTEHVGPAPRH